MPLEVAEHNWTEALATNNWQQECSPTSVAPCYLRCVFPIHPSPHWYVDGNLVLLAIVVGLLSYFKTHKTMPRPVKTATAREEDVVLRGSQRRQLRERERDEKTLLFIGSQNVLIDLATFKFHYRQLLVNKLTIAGWLSVCFCVKVSQASHHPWLHIFPDK